MKVLWFTLVLVAATSPLACNRGENTRPKAGWAAVLDDLKDVEVTPNAVGEVVFFDSTRGLKENVRLLRVRVDEDELEKLLRPLQVLNTDGLGKCEVDAFLAWSQEQAWQPPKPGQDYRCGVGHLKSRSPGPTWLVFVFVAPEGMKQLSVYVAMSQGT